MTSEATTGWDIARFLCGPVLDCVAARHGFADDTTLATLQGSVHDRDSTRFAAAALGMSRSLLAAAHVASDRSGPSAVPVAYLLASQGLVQLAAALTDDADIEHHLAYAADLAVFLADGGHVTTPIRLVADGTSISRALEAAVLLDIGVA